MGAALAAQQPAVRADGEDHVGVHRGPPHGEASNGREKGGGLGHRSQKSTDRVDFRRRKKKKALDDWMKGKGKGLMRPLSREWP